MNILRVLNTLLLAGILSALVLILLQLRAPVAIQQPVEVQGPENKPFALHARALPVTIQDAVLGVQIEDQPIEVKITR